MAGLTNFFENAALDHMIGGPDLTRPPFLYIALFLDTPSEAGVGAEVSGLGYARVEKANTGALFSGASGGMKTTLAEIVFNEASGMWGIIVGVGVFDAATMGNLLFYATLDSPAMITSGQTAKFLTGSLSFTLD